MMKKKSRWWLDVAKVCEQGHNKISGLIGAYRVEDWIGEIKFLEIIR